MMYDGIKRAGLAMLVGLWLWASTAVAQPQDPQALVQNTTERLLERLEEQRAVIQAEPERLYDLVDDLVVPHFDFVRMSRWVLGRKYWTEATAEQKTRFVLAFRTLLVRTYATALFEYTGQSVNFLPLRDDPAKGDATVRSEVVQRGAAPIAINYSLYEKDGAWKVYDVTVDGISLLANYRANFSAEIRQGGLEALISRLESRTRTQVSS